MNVSLDIGLLRSAYSYVAGKYLHETEKEIQILEPISTLIKLAIISFKNDGTKIAISDHSIYVQSPSPFQGTKRWLYGNSREELHQLLKPLYRCTQLLNPETDTNAKVIYNLAISGLKKLKKSYGGSSSTINHTIDLYISVLQSNLLDKTIYIDSITGGGDSEKVNTDDDKTPLDFSISARINFNELFKDVWSDDDIRLVATLFTRAEEIKDTNETEKKNYIKAIENILTAKDTIIHPIIMRCTHIS
jgi:hypothetical protein